MEFHYGVISGTYKTGAKPLPFFFKQYFPDGAMWQLCLFIVLFMPLKAGIEAAADHFIMLMIANSVARFYILQRI